MVQVGIVANRAAAMLGMGRQMRGIGSIAGAFSSLAIQKPLWRREEHNRAGQAAWRRFCVRAADVSGPGSVDSLIAGMQSKIQDQLKAEEVIVKDAYGDGRHVSIEVVAEVFEGQTQVNRQRMVYKAIWEELQNAVHAVDQLKTRTPSEAKK